MFIPDRVAEVDMAVLAAFRGHGLGRLGCVDNAATADMVPFLIDTDPRVDARSASCGQPARGHQERIDELPDYDGPRHRL